MDNTGRQAPEQAPAPSKPLVFPCESAPAFLEPTFHGYHHSAVVDGGMSRAAVDGVAKEELETEKKAFFFFQQQVQQKPHP